MASSPSMTKFSTSDKGVSRLEEEEIRGGGEGEEEEKERVENKR